MEKTIKVGSDFSGVGAFDYAINRVAEKKNFTIENIFACDMDKYARQSYLASHEAPNYYPENVYEREIPQESLDIYMTSPPCQSFSLAGKRKGKTDKRGVLFFNSHEFIKKNKPRFFIFENVKGLLSDDNGNTFNEWVNMLGGKSVNGNPIIFAYEDSVPYHLYFKVLNTKEHGVPQNRERIFLIGIRDDDDNDFQFPKEEPLKKKLKDLLEPIVDEKYFLSDKMLENITLENKQNGEVANLNKGGERGSVYSESTEAMSCLTATDYKQPKQILVKSNTKKGYDIATENDSINFSIPTSTTRRGRVGVGVAQTLDTQCNQGVIAPTLTTMCGDDSIIVGGTIRDFKNEKGEKEGFREVSGGVSPTLLARARNDGSGMAGVSIDYKVRKLTPLECFRCQDFPDSHVENAINAGISNSQLYKQAGNSITVRVLEKIIDKLKL